MKALALIGSTGFAVYIIVALALTFYNVSRHVFSLDEDPEAAPGMSFFGRQFTIVFWPLVAVSSEGREFLRVIWKGNQ